MASGDVIVGIDLGTTYSAIGVVDRGFPILLANEDGERTIPSAVWLGADGSREVGARALRRRSIEPERVFCSIKRDMGKAPTPRAAALNTSAEELSAEILRELKRIAEWRLEQPVFKAVITVPAYFSDAERAATKRAGELAGFEVMRVFNEPTAAALAYGLERRRTHSRIAVYDWGGGTFDCSILELREGCFEVLATSGDTRLGGDDLDAALATWLMTHAGEVPHAAYRRFLVVAERAKRELSSRENCMVRVPFYDGTHSFEYQLERKELDQLALPWIERTLSCCRRALADARVQASELDAVVLVGGSTKMPLVQERVASFFGRMPDTSQHPEEAVALGACIQAGILAGSLQHVVLFDVTPLSLGIETFGGLMNVIIPRNTTIPCRAGEQFTNAVDSQSTMRIRVLQGEREMARDNRELGTFDIAFKPAPRGQARVGVQFRIDENGILEVLARDLATGNEQVLEITHTAVDVDELVVDQLIEESVTHATDDMAERILTEARLKAEELLLAVEEVFAAGLCQPDERAIIFAAKEQLEAAMKSTDASRLKAAVDELDRCTEAVAARLVEQALAAALPEGGAGES